VFVTVIFAPVTTAPAESATVPRIVVEVVCANAASEERSRTNSKDEHNHCQPRVALEVYIHEPPKV
jgi:hypothetical protein